jgi:hypothetical protein
MWNLPLSESNRKKELEYIVQMAQINGYEKDLIMRINRKHRERMERRKVTTLKPIDKRDMVRKTQGKGSMIRHISMPFHDKLTNKISNKLKSCGLNTVYHSRGNLKNFIGKVKKKRPKMELSGIYNIQCLDCEGNYVGQTRRRIDTRIKEHERALRLKQEDKSAMALHCLEEKHEMGDCTVLKEVNNVLQLDAWESLFIAKGEDLVNTGEPPISSKLFDRASIKKRERPLRKS